MLPLLKKTTNHEFQASQIKLYNPPRQLTNFDSQNERKMSMMSSSRANNKIRVMAGGFRKQDPSYQSMKNHLGGNKSLQQPTYATVSMQPPSKNPFIKLQSNSNLSAEIKLIEKKIRYHKKKLQEEKKKKEEMQKNKNDPFSNDFEKIIQREMELQGYPNVQDNEQKGFDYLTNPGKVNQQEEELPVEEKQPDPPLVLPEPKKFDISQKIQKLQKHYEHSLKKKFQRRQMFPHFPCKRKTPKLYVTAKTNALQKFGKKPDQQEHMFRVMTKQCTPQQIYPTIPNFAIVKDNLSKNVLAYLTDFQPFIEKSKEEEENQQAPENDIRVQTSEDGQRIEHQKMNSTGNIDRQNNRA